MASAVSTTQADDEAIRKKREEIQRLKRQQNAKSRLDFITGKTDKLVEVEPIITPIKPKEEENPQIIEHGGNSAQGPPSKGNLLFRMASVTFLSLLLALNSTLIFPQTSILTHLDLSRPVVTGTYLGLFLFLERLMGNGVFSGFHDTIWLIYTWIAVVDFLFVTLGTKYSAQQSPIIWILVISLVLEFILGVVLKIARKIPNPLLQAFAPGPIIWMARNFVRMAIVMGIVMFFPDLGDIEMVDIPRWLNSTAGVVIWSWISLITGADVASFFLN